MEGCNGEFSKNVAGAKIYKKVSFNKADEFTEAVGNIDKQGSLRKVINIAGKTAFACLLLIMLVLVCSIVQGRVSGGPPQVAGYQMYIVLGGSMSPEFEAGSLAFLQPIKPGDIQVGDIITFRTFPERDGLTTHRVVKIIKEGDQFAFLTRGDANKVNDPFVVPDKNVVGQIVFAVPYVGYFLHFGHTKMGLLLFVILPAVLFVLFQLRHFCCYICKPR